MNGSDKISIREAIGTDAQAVSACLEAAFAPFRAAYTAGAFADTVPSTTGIAERMQRLQTFVACAETGTVVGTIACTAHGGEGHLRGMAVRPEWQGQAVAASLLHAAEEHLRCAGCTRVTLDTTAPLVRAIRFYERHGYARSGNVQDFYGMPLFEFVKHLSPAGRGE